MNAEMGAKRGGDPLNMPELQFAFELRETSRLLLNAFKTRITPHGMTLAHYYLMRQLWAQEGISQAELSARLQTTQAASVPTIDVLEGRGVLKRVRDTADRRVTRLYLTAKGKTLFLKMVGYAAEISVASLDGFRKSDLERLRTLLAEVRDNLAAPRAGEEDAS
ncbi:MAG TPA: MarR family transcriptional regulator [Candidatus Aquilonibacter sp.]